VNSKQEVKKRRKPTILDQVKEMTSEERRRALEEFSDSDESHHSEEEDSLERHEDTENGYLQGVVV
jgi:hypothetical protein